MIHVTKTFLPEKALFDHYTDRIWSNGWITNNGELLQELSQKLKQFLNVGDIQLTSNGTLPMQMALRAMELEGEIITTPFSYIATSSAIVWEKLTPIFVDIDPEHLTIDESKIENAITDKTSAILATHVFGNPCNIEAIEQIASRHNLKVIYDAAHCFGVEYKGQSVFNYGDVSTCSFHATKLFHTTEGGALFPQNKTLSDTLQYMANFGHNGKYGFQGVGINAKMSELHASMGLCVLQSMEKILAGRKDVVAFYEKHLNLESIRLMKLREGTKWNYSYFPVIFDSHEALMDCIEILTQKSINPRRYFYPSLNTIEYLKGQSMPIAESIADNILCLPLYYDLPFDKVFEICEAVNQVQGKKVLAV